MAWVLAFLIRVRYDVPVAWVAAMAGVGDQSLRDCLSFLRPDGWHTLSRTALLLGFYPDELERLTRRWMRKYRHREQRLHGMERGWRLLYPWEKTEQKPRPALRSETRQRSDGRPDP
jgi:hypothetical protein